MKMTKKPINSCTCAIPQSAQLPDSIPDRANEYRCAVDGINKAIEALAKIASTDKVAAESIANLSVVLLDLKANE